MNTMWRVNEDVRILKKSGVLDRSRFSSESEDGVRPMKPRNGVNNYQLIHNQLEESNSDEEDSLFDKDSLLRTGATPKGVKSGSKAAVFPLILLLFTFFNLGLWLGIVGPTLPDLHANSSNRQFSSTLVLITCNSVASILGLIFGAYIFRLTNVFFMIPLSLLCGGVITIVIPWVKGFNGILICFFLQGSLLGLIEKGGFNLFIGYWRRKGTILHLFYLSLAIGGFLAPLLATPFVFSRMSGGDGHLSIANRTMSLANVSPRVRRSLVTNDMQNSSDIENLTVLNSTGDVVKLNQTDENVPNFNNTAEFISTSISTSLQPKKPLIADGNNLPNDGPESYSEIKKKANEKPNEAKVAFSNSTTISSTLAIMTSNTSILLTSWTTVPTISSTTTSVTTSTFTTTTVPTTSATISNNSEVNKGDSTVRYLSWRDYWIHFLHEVKSNRFQMSYVIISVVPMVVVLLMCCAVACRFGADMRNWQTPPPSHGGVDGGASSIEPLGSGANDLFQPRSARKQPGRPEKYQRYTVSAAVLFFFLLMGMESAVYNLLTYYVAVGKGTAQSSGVEMTAVFWISIAISRLLAIFVRSSMSSRAILTLCHVAMIFTSSIVLAFTSTTVTVLTNKVISTSAMSGSSWALEWFGFAGFGLAIGPLMPVSLAWLDERLRPSATVLSLIIGAGHAGRAVVPILTAVGMVSYDPVSLVLCICVGSVFSSILATIMYKLGRIAGELQVLTDLTKEVRGHNGDVAVYQKMNSGAKGNSGGNHVGVKDYPVSDELLFDIGGVDDFDTADDFVHFDLRKDLQSRGADVTQKVSSMADPTGKFSNYFQKM